MGDRHQDIGWPWAGIPSLELCNFLPGAAQRTLYLVAPILGFEGNDPGSAFAHDVFLGFAAALAGRGAQGVVYRARRSGLAGDVALKRLVAGSFATPAMRHRFDREIHAASTLDHPNIVRILAIDEVDSQQLLAMEWVDGVPITRAWRVAPVRRGTPGFGVEPGEGGFGSVYLAQQQEPLRRKVALKLINYDRHG